MSTKWRYPLDNNLKRQEILAEIISHSITRIRSLNGKERECLAAEYKEWFLAEPDFEVMYLDHKELNS